jgi:hypothetical protein
MSILMCNIYINFMLQMVKGRDYLEEIVEVT